MMSTMNYMMKKTRTMKNMNLKSLKMSYMMMNSLMMNYKTKNMNYCLSMKNLPNSIPKLVNGPATSSPSSFASILRPLQ